MKKIIAILVFLWGAATYAQEISVTHTAKPPLFYLDSMKVSSNYLFVDPANIERVDVVKSYDSGKVFIKMKNKNLLASLKQITDAHASKDTETQVLYIVDNKIITDTMNVRIDTSFIKNVEFTSAGNIQYLIGSPKMTICIIETKAPKTTQKQEGIMIRGAAVKENDSRFF